MILPGVYVSRKRDFLTVSYKDTSSPGHV